MHHHEEKKRTQTACHADAQEQEANCACGHAHDHHHDHGEEENRKPLIIRLIAAVLLAGCAYFVSFAQEMKIILYCLAYLIAGYDVLMRSVKNIAHGELFDENFLMALASVGAMCLQEFVEGVAVMVLYQFGELLQDLAVDKSRDSIKSLVDVRPDKAYLEKNGKIVEIDPEKVEVGSILVVRPGERVPIDGVVVEGTSDLDTAALTGESAPQTVQTGMSIYSGSVNLTGGLKIQTNRLFSESTASRILEMVEQANQNKAHSERFITRFARIYTPVVVALAVCLAILPPLLTGDDFSVWLHRALSFLVISCPCALVISVPLTFFSGIGGASRYGILMKGALHLENLSKVAVAVFDKTGTLTQGAFSVSEIVSNECTEKQLLLMAAQAEQGSSHPIAQAIVLAAGRRKDEYDSDITHHNEAGKGVWAESCEKIIAVGSEELMNEQGVLSVFDTKGYTAVHIAESGQYRGCILLEDKVKPSSKNALALLKKEGVQKTVILTGDGKYAAERTAKEVGADEVRYRQLPDDKVRVVVEMKSLLGTNEKLIFAGDGINDAPVLLNADVGIAMGAMGSDAAVEAADVVLMDDDPAKIPLAVQIAKKTMHICRENILFSIAVKVFVLILSALGISCMGMAVFADVGVCLLAVCNAVRASKV